MSNLPRGVLQKSVGATTDLKTQKKLFITNHMTLKPSIRSYFSKIGSKGLLLCKLLMKTHVPDCSTSAGGNSIQAETYVLPLETATNTIKHEEACSFCQKQNACT